MQKAHVHSLMTACMPELGGGRCEDTRHPSIRKIGIRACHVPGPAGGAEETTEKKMNKSLHPCAIYHLVGKEHKQVSW